MDLPEQESSPSQQSNQDTVNSDCPQDSHLNKYCLLYTSSLEKQEYFTFSQAARLMGVSRQYIYKLVKEDKLRASRRRGPS